MGELETERTSKSYSDDGSERQEMGIDHSSHEAVDDDTPSISVFPVKTRFSSS